MSSKAVVLVFFADLCFPRLVTLLLDNGANPNQSDRDNMTPLLIAAFEGKAAVCEILLENQADVDHTDKEGETFLSLCSH